MIRRRLTPPDPPAMTDGRNHAALAARAFLESEAQWPHPEPDYEAPLSGRYRNNLSAPRS